MKRLLATFGAALLLAGCTTSDNTLAPKTVESVDLKRYQGTWYEQARLPMFFQRNCAQSEAHYSLKPDGNVAVLNRCRTAEGEWEEAKGTATPQVAGKTDKLWVEFDNWVSSVLPGVTGLGSTSTAAVRRFTYSDRPSSPALETASTCASPVRM